MSFWTWLDNLFSPVPIPPDPVNTSGITTSTLYTMASGKPCLRDHVGNITKRIHYIGRFMIDGDGKGPSYGDPDYQKTTSYKHNGQDLDSSAEDYGVGYPGFIEAVPEIVLGCQGRLTHIPTGISFPMVCGDVGPHTGYGEGSEHLANRFKAAGVDISSSPTSGGDEGLNWLWEWWPGSPAVVDDIAYPLQPY